MAKTVVILSGGLDSTTLLYHLRDKGHEFKALSVDYRQRHAQRELAAAKEICRRLDVEQRVVDRRSAFKKAGVHDPTMYGS